MSKINSWIINKYESELGKYRIWNNGVMIIFDKISEDELIFAFYLRDVFVCSFDKVYNRIKNLIDYKHLIGK
jgi:hypothetical protein